jgi:hypothetical protein
MRLAGDDELHRTLAIGKQAQQSLAIVQQQVRPFIGCEAACETQCQRVRIK